MKRFACHYLPYFRHGNVEAATLQAEATYFRENVASVRRVGGRKHSRDCFREIRPLHNA